MTVDVILKGLKRFLFQLDFNTLKKKKNHSLITPHENSVTDVELGLRL